MNRKLEPKVMDHKHAVKNMMAERFALHELSEQEREAFETHFYECSECSQATQHACDFLDHARDTLHPKTELVARRSPFGFLADLWRPAPAIISALFLCAMSTAVYQTTQVADLRRPWQQQRVYLPEAVRSVRSESLSNEKTISVQPHFQLALEMGFPPSKQYTSYRVLLRNELRGKTEYAVPIRTVSDEYSVTIVLPAETLSPGHYSMIAEGLDSNGKWQTLTDSGDPVEGRFQIIAPHK